MTYGTSYFPTFAAACTYYRAYKCKPADVEKKIAEGLIHIGAPAIEPGERLVRLDGGLRYGIQETKELK